jgi:hypothetical protein
VEDLVKEPVRIHVPQDEIDARRALVEATEAFENDRPPVHIFVDSPFFCRAAGVPIDQIYKSPEAMLRAQILGYKVVLESVDCDVFRPAVGFDFGSCLTASTYGCRVIEQAGGIPGFEPWLRDDADLAKLEGLDPRTNGMRSREIDYWHRYHEVADDFPVQFDGGEPFFPARDVRLGTGSEGPFSIACMVAGFDNVSLWCYDRPEFVTRLLDVITGKEIERIHHSFKLLGEEPSRIGIADDYSPYVSLAMYEELILPSQLRLRDAFGGTLDFHSCIPDAKLLAHWRDDLNIRLFNGFKPLDGLANLQRDYAPVAEAMAGRVILEPDIDGANVMVASEKDLGQAALDWLEVFGAHKGVKLCATISGGHRLDDLEKVNVLKRTVLGTRPDGTGH